MAVIDKLAEYRPEAAFAYYYKGLILSRRGHGERALVSFKEALVAELQQDTPDGLNLRLFRDKIREAEETLPIESAGLLPRSGPRR